MEFDLDLVREQASKVAKRMDVLGFPESIDLLGRHKLETSVAIAMGHMIEAVMPLLSLCEKLLDVGPIYSNDQQISMGMDLVLIILAKVAEDWKKANNGVPSAVLEEMLEHWIKAKTTFTGE